ncbi:MAG: dihydropteroate synthase [Candidatus Firestonebacteria bacterium]
MLIVGERINATRKLIGEAVTKRDREVIIKEVMEQEKAGAKMIDVNSGKSPDKEIEDMKWLIEVAQSVTNLPLCLDSANPKVLEVALKLNKNGKPLVNSVTDEQKKIEEVCPLVKEHNSGIVALTIDEKGVPNSVERRKEITNSLVKKIVNFGVKIEDIYVDPCIFPISTDTVNAIHSIESIKWIKSNFPGIKTVIGLSNVSYGLPLRGLMNQAFIVLCINAGLDAAIIDPLDKKMVSLIYATNCLLNLDEYCLEYITAAKKGKLM